MKETYRSILQKIFEQRKAKNPSYSLVAYSRDAGYKSYHMNDILSGRYGLSTKTAVKVAQNLKMSDTLKEEFITLVTVEHARSDIEKNAALDKLQKLRYHTDMTISDQDLEDINEWYYMAIITLAHKVDFKADAEYISRQLNLPLTTAENALNKIFDLGIFTLTEQNNIHINFDGVLGVRPQTPGSAATSIRKYHKQMLKMATEAIETYPVSERSYSSFNVNLTQPEYEIFCSEISSFIREKIHNTIRQQAPAESRLYSINLNLIPLEK